MNSHFTEHLHETVRLPSASAEPTLFWDATLPPNLLMSSSSLLIYLLPARWCSSDLWHLTNATCVEYFDLSKADVTHSTKKKKSQGGGSIQRTFNTLHIVFMCFRHCNKVIMSILYMLYMYIYVCKLMLGKVSRVGSDYIEM